jgi:hypothetical protein
MIKDIGSKKDLVDKYYQTAMLLPFCVRMMIRDKRKTDNTNPQFLLSLMLVYINSGLLEAIWNRFLLNIWLIILSARKCLNQ